MYTTPISRARGNLGLGNGEEYEWRSGRPYNMYGSPYAPYDGYGRDRTYRRQDYPGRSYEWRPRYDSYGARYDFERPRYNSYGPSYGYGRSGYDDRYGDRYGYNSYGRSYGYNERYGDRYGYNTYGGYGDRRYGGV